MSPRPSKTSLADLDALGQLGMFHETAGDAVRELARTYVSPATKEHGVKAFAKRLFPKKSDEQAYTRLMNCTNPNSAEVFDDDDWREIIRIGYEQNKHIVAEYFCGREYQVTPIKPEEIKRQAKKARRRALLAELAKLDEEDE